MAPRLLYGRGIYSDLAFNEVIMTLVSFGYREDLNLTADREAQRLAVAAGYNSKALVSYLERCAGVQASEPSQLVTAAPGLPKRLAAAHGYSSDTTPRREE